MARHKEFDRDTALKAAIDVFSEHGYEGTSTDALLAAMKISRQSMYDTFGDKRSLYLEALKRYNIDSVRRSSPTCAAKQRPSRRWRIRSSPSPPARKCRPAAAASASAPSASSAAPTLRSRP